MSLRVAATLCRESSSGCHSMPSGEDPMDLKIHHIYIENKKWSCLSFSHCMDLGPTISAAYEVRVWRVASSDDRGFMFDNHALQPI